MTYQDLRSAIDSNRPFTITMEDGREYPVSHRDFVAFSAKRTTMLVTTEDDRIHYLPLVTMKTLTPASDAGSGSTLA
mgnify:CR=1 FL=1